MIVDAYSHVCPERLMDAIADRHPGAEAAALPGLAADLDLILSGNLHRIV